MDEQKQKIALFLEKYSIASSIVLAAIIISGTIFFTRSPIGVPNSGTTKGSAKIGDTAGQNQAAKPTDIKINSNDHVLGNKDAKVSIIEYSDFRCPFCERFFTQTESQLIKDYVNTGKANFVFRHFAFLGPQSTWASEAAECASEQGKFWEFHNWLYKNQASESDLNYYSKANLVKYAGKVGLDTAQFASCLNSDKYAKRVSDDSDSGKAIGVTGTPTIFINGQKIVGAQPYASFQSIIDDLLK